jgi:hypothetical protein
MILSGGKTMPDLPQTGSAARTGEHAGGWNLVTAGGALKPVPAMAALGLGHPLLLFALGTDAVHLPLLDVVSEDEGTAGALGQIAPADLGAATGGRADEYALAGAAPEFSLGRFLANRAFVHVHLLFPQWFWNTSIAGRESQDL